MNTVEKIVSAFNAGQAGIVLTSVEPEDCLEELTKAAIKQDEPWHLHYWDIADGLTDMYGDKITPNAAQAQDNDLAALGISGQQEEKTGLEEALKFFRAVAKSRIERTARDESAPEDEYPYILCVRNFDRLLMPSGGQGQVDPVLLSYVQKLIKEGQSSKVFLILQTTPEFDLPSELVVHCEYINHDLPTSEERANIIRDLEITDTVSPDMLNATAGLSRAKTTQYVAEVASSYGYINANAIFQKKATHLSRSSKLDVWSPEFVQSVKLWPSAELEEFRDATDVTMIQEENEHQNRDLEEGQVRVRVKYIQNGKKVEKWLDPMDAETFNTQFKPERDFYSLKSVVGLSGLKEFLRKGFRADVPDRAKMKHVLMLGVPGTGKSFMMQCCSGEFQQPLSSMQASNLYSKWLGDTDKMLSRMLETVEMIGGILAIDEFQRFLPQGGSGGESGGVENRLLGTLLTWFNNQQSNLVLSAANNISNLPDEITRSGRVDALMFVGFPGREAKDAAWNMYLKRHELENQELPTDNYWTPADIMSCCRLAELQQCSVKDASKWITPSYEKNSQQMDSLMDWAEQAGCICAETGERFVHPSKRKVAEGRSKKMTRKIKTNTEN